MQKLGVFILLVLFGQLTAQSFKYGITGNVHKSSILEVHDRSEGKWGGGAGFFAQWPLVENDIYDSAWLYFTPQLEYNMMGELADAGPDKYEKQKFYMDYISLSAYIKYFFHKGNMKRDIFVFGGPKVEFLVRKDRKVPAEYDLVYYKYNLDKKVNDFGFGFSLGVGLKINDFLESFLRYDRGFSKVYPDNVSRNTANHMLSLGVNYYLSRD